MGAAAAGYRVAMAEQPDPDVTLPELGDDPSSEGSQGPLYPGDTSLTGLQVPAEQGEPPAGAGQAS